MFFLFKQPPQLFFLPFCWRWALNYVVIVDLPVVFRCHTFKSYVNICHVPYVCSRWLNEICLKLNIYMYVYIFLCVFIMRVRTFLNYLLIN